VWVPHGASESAGKWSHWTTSGDRSTDLGAVLDLQCLGPKVPTILHSSINVPFGNEWIVAQSSMHTNAALLDCGAGRQSPASLSSGHSWEASCVWASQRSSSSPAVAWPGGLQPQAAQLVLWTHMFSHCETALENFIHRDFSWKREKPGNFLEQTQGSWNLTQFNLFVSYSNYWPQKNQWKKLHKIIGYMLCFVSKSEIALQVPTTYPVIEWHMDTGRQTATSITAWIR
jgi:hypothetical protein